MFVEFFSDASIFYSKLRKKANFTIWDYSTTSTNKKRLCLTCHLDLKMIVAPDDATERESYSELLPK